jgi:hypothetical protein
MCAGEKYKLMKIKTGITEAFGNTVSGTRESAYEVL